MMNVYSSFSHYSAFSHYYKLPARHLAHCTTFPSNYLLRAVCKAWQRLLIHCILCLYAEWWQWKITHTGTSGQFHYQVVLDVDSTAYWYFFHKCLILWLIIGFMIIFKLVEKNKFILVSTCICVIVCTNFFIILKFNKKKKIQVLSCFLWENHLISTQKSKAISFVYSLSDVN